MKVLFAHGLESGPRGQKAVYLQQRFEAHVPAMDTHDFAGCVELHRRAISEFGPDVLVGSSFGGAVAVALLQSGDWRGPTLLLAPAALRYGLPARLPAGVRVVIVHGTRDSVVPLADSRALVAARPGEVELVEVDDGHRLPTLLEGERLADLVRATASPAPRG